MDSQLWVSFLMLVVVDIALDVAFRSLILEILKVPCALSYGGQSLHLQCLW